MNSAVDNSALETEIADFIKSRRSLQLATLGEDGIPYASYAPFAFSDNGFYILISEIAVHAKNLQLNPSASAMIIEDEDSASELFARMRVSYQLEATLIEVDTPAWTKGVETLVERQGKLINHLSQHADFKLFELTPTKGRFVKGFGRAYALKGTGLLDNSIEHLRDGHVKR